MHLYIALHLSPSSFNKTFTQKMDATLMVRQSSVNLKLFPVRQPNSCYPHHISFQLRRTTLPQSLKAAIPAYIRSQIIINKQPSIHSPPMRIPSPAPAPAQLFVGLPLDVVSDANTPNHTKAIAAGLRALKLLGVHGVELPINWAVVQTDSPDKFNWTAYLAVAAAVHDAGLHLRVSLNLHSNLPRWISDIADTNPNVLFTDRSGRRFSNCLSLSVDDLPVLDGATPLNAYENLFLSFQSSFSYHIGTTIIDVTVSLGPEGELRYPSFLSPGSQFTGVGEFQCYDKYMLDSLRAHAEATGNHLWGLGGPHNAPHYGQAADTGFFKDDGGSWETPYGKFFLSWYSSQLTGHADRVLRLASKVFHDSSIKVSGKVPLLHCWYNTRSRPALLTAGYYHTDRRDGFDAVAEVFGKNNCNMIIPGMDIAETDRPRGVCSSPEGLLSDIMKACDKHKVQVVGENSSSRVGVGARFGRIKENVLQKSVVSFTYQRMGAYFFSPEHWPRFTEFVRSLSAPEMDADDMLAVKNERVARTMDVSGRERVMQTV